MHPIFGLAWLPTLAADGRGMDPSAWTLFAGVAVLTAVMLRIAYRARLRSAERQGSRGSAQDAGQDSRGGGFGGGRTSQTTLREADELLRQLDRQQVQLNELSRDAQARLDNKITVLQRLLAESESAIARLDEAAKKHQSQ